MKNKVFVKRETFEMNGKSFFTYFVNGNVRGKEVRASVMPQDKGGYQVLDIIFGNDDKAELVLNPYEYKDEKTGKTIKGNSFLARNVDEDGVVYELPVKPNRASDKAFINMILQ